LRTIPDVSELGPRSGERPAASRSEPSTSVLPRSDAIALDSSQGIVEPLVLDAWSHADCDVCPRLGDEIEAVGLGRPPGAILDTEPAVMAMRHEIVVRSPIAVGSRLPPHACPG
jgi:hypothetical protein